MISLYQDVAYTKFYNKLNSFRNMIPVLYVVYVFCSIRNGQIKHKCNNRNITPSTVYAVSARCLLFFYSIYVASGFGTILFAASPPLFAAKDLRCSFKTHRALLQTCIWTEKTQSAVLLRNIRRKKISRNKHLPTPNTRHK